MKKILAVAVACLFVVDAAAQAVDGSKIFKGRIKPGMYEQRDETVMRGYGLPANQEKTTETKKHCYSAKEVDQGIELRNDCKFTKVKETPTSLQLTGTCPGGSKEEFSVEATGSGFKTRLSSVGKDAAGKPMESSMVSEAKYLGPC